MKILITLQEVLRRCNDWDIFCADKGYSEWCVKEGGGDIEIELTEKEALKYGLIATVLEDYL